MSADTLTVLTSTSGKHAAKRFSVKKDGSIQNRSYGSEMFFAVSSIAVAGIAELARELERIAGNPFGFVIRGEPLPGINRKHTRRLLHSDKKTGDPATFREQPRHGFVVDVDHIHCPAAIDPKLDPDGAVEYVIGLLPPELTDATCWWQFSSSQSVFDDATLSMHLWFWSLEPLADAALKRWAAAANQAVGYKLIDPTLYSPVQAHYVAAPLFNGLRDPLPRRCGLRQGLDDAVGLLIPPPHPKRPEEPWGEGYEPGLGVEAYIAELGGPKGFRTPILSAAASYIASCGSAADAEPLKRLIRTAIDRADPGGRSVAEIDRYRSDEHLDAIVEWVRTHHGDTPPKGFHGEPPPHVADPGIPIDDTTDAAPDADGPIIRVAAGRRHEAADQGLAAMYAAGVAFYRRDRGLVRVCLIKAKNTDGEIILVPGIMPVTAAMLCRALGQSACWERINSKGLFVRIDPPDKIVEQIMGMVDEWPFPPLVGVVACPTLRSDGSLLQRQGYDLATGLVLYKTVPIPSIPEFPTRLDADRAIMLLRGLLQEFPFVNEASRSVALSQIMTPVLRGAFPVAPMHLTNAPEAGTGKSYLADITSATATGERIAALSVAPNPEETEKRLIGAVLAGYPIIALDNVRQLLQGDFLCQVTERPLLQLRRLGSSDEVRVANTFTALVNGNNAIVADDLVRRTITCTLDANMEAPERRTFNTNPLAMVLHNRGAYIAACLTIARAYIAAGKPDRLPPLPSYEGWSDLVRSALVWLGCPDPVSTMEAARRADPVRQDRLNVFMAWRDELILNEGYLVPDLAELAEVRNDSTSNFVRQQLHATLLAIAQQRGAGGAKIDARRLGIWLKKK